MTENQGSLSDVVVSVTTDGRKYDMTLGDFSAQDEMDYERATGRDLMGVFMGSEGFTTIAVAGLVWLTRRRFEKKLQFSTVARAFKWSDLETLDINDPNDDDSEAPESDGKAKEATHPEG